MKEAAMMFPIRPGKTDALIEFAQTVSSDKSAEFGRAHPGVDKETWYLQPSSHGDFCIVHMIAEDPLAVFAKLAVSEEPFDVWFRDQVLDITRVDLKNPPPMLPPTIFQWTKTP